MNGKVFLAVAIILVLILGGLYYLLQSANISALAEPGSLETLVATRIRDALVAHAATTVPEPEIRNDAANVSEGKDLYGMACASCHGRDGRNPAPIGKSMYPRVPSLASSDVQKLSDREIFWVVKNGIRLSGMPGFARIETDEQIWQLTYFVRSLNAGASQTSAVLRSLARSKQSRRQTETTLQAPRGIEIARRNGERSWKPQ